jgi:Ferric reductase like transmembrane component
MRSFKSILFVTCLVPLALLAWDGYAGKLGVNRIETITHSTGSWTLIFLLITLSVTPLRRLSGWRDLIKFRRMLGLYAFFYACLHFTTYVWLDQFFDLQRDRGGTALSLAGQGRYQTASHLRKYPGFSPCMLIYGRTRRERGFQVFQQKTFSFFLRQTRVLQSSCGATGR